MRTEGIDPCLFQDCRSFAGPVDGDINSCLNTDLSTCSAYIREECQYAGGRVPGNTQLIHEKTFFTNFLQIIWSLMRVTSQASQNVKIGQRIFSPLVQSSSSSMESQRTARSLLLCTRHATPLEDLQRHLLWRNAKVS